DKLTHLVAKQYNCKVFTTDSFYANGAHFNKFLALEECFHCIGRIGWNCLLDADVLIPKAASWDFLQPCNTDTLYAPVRHMYDTLYKREGELYIPAEHKWSNYKIHPN